MEETILLSKKIDQHEHLSNKKIIAIKQIPISKLDTEMTPTKNGEDVKTALEIEIANLKQEIASLKQQREKILFDIKEQVDREKEAWQTEKEQERKRAQQQGYEEGYQKAQEEALQKYDVLIEQANNIVQKATEDYHRTIEKHEHAIITLAIKTAEKIITKEIEQDETYVTSIIRKAMEDLKDHSNVAIHVSPNDYDLVMNQKDELEQSLKDGEILSIYVDQKLNEGDCIISHPYGQIDISIDLQLEQIKHALEQKLTENQ